ncbi:hypothetical protein ZIOFF_052210 [Zingiber officinale]|uniref:Uncharacterized protein n=1 Tax=Zingiber officinale TaxID=94328 RepID=A0A8J5FU36_ZINOF|nr:hypothetical protein ZIOFF_052210 [Zingiber officinale]
MGCFCFVYGDQDKPALITYPDVALNFVTVGLFVSSEAASLVLHNFCIYLVSPPGLEVLFDFLYFYGICGFIKDCLLQQYFSKVTEEQPCAIVLIDITSTHCRRSPCCIYPELLSPESLRV